MVSSSRIARLSRRSVCGGIFGLAVAPRVLWANTGVVVYKDPNCGCCDRWAKHVAAAGFSVRIEEARDLNAVRSLLGVPADLAGCHTAEAGGYLVEGHVPVGAISRLLQERPHAAGLAVPGMPAGSPGMDGDPQRYPVILFGPSGRRTYMQFLGSQEIGG